MSYLYEDILRRTLHVIGEAAKPVALHAPSLHGNEQKYVAQTIEENWVSSAGAFVSRFERELAAYCGVRHAVAVVNGTAALHAAMHVLGIGHGDEVLVPSATFVASGNAISHAGAVPHFIDCEEQTLGADPVRLRAYLQDIARPDKDGVINKITGRKIKAIIPVHIFGVPCNIDEIESVAREFGLLVIQDSTEALGASYEGNSVLSYGNCATLSFNGNKIITSGGGGAIVTNDEILAQKIRHITTTAKQPHSYAFFHDEVAYNYRMPNINAALACAQLEQMDDFIARKKVLASKYIQAFQGFSEGVFMVCDEKRQSNYWLNTLKLNTPNREDLYKGIGYINEQGIHARPLWTPLHQLPMYKDAPRMKDLVVTESVAASIVNLPSSAFLVNPVS